MKKSKIVVALAAVFVGGAALAQSSVTLYGRINTSYEYQSQKFDRSVSDVADNVSTSNNTQSYSQKFSGLTQRNNSSRWGIKGKEELGSTGLNATFKVESSFASDVGGGGSADRRAWVGLEGDQFGKLRLGSGGGGGDLSPFYAQFDDNVYQANHDNGTTAVFYSKGLSYFDIARPAGMYDPSSNTTAWSSATGVAATGATFGTTTFTSTFGAASGGNNIAYVSPNLLGKDNKNQLTIGARIGLTGTNDSIKANSKDLGTGRESDTKLYDLTIDFKNDLFYVGLGYQGNSGKAGAYTSGTTRTLASNKVSRFQLVGSWNTPVQGLTVSGLVGMGKDKFKSHTDAIDAATGNVTAGNDAYSLKNSLRYFQVGAKYQPAEVGFDVGGNLVFVRGKLTGTDFNGTTTATNSWTDDTNYSTKVTRQQYQVAAGYNFSKRTRVYTFIDYQKTKETGSYRGVDSTSVGGANASDDGRSWKGTLKQTTLGLGLRHAF